MKDFVITVDGKYLYVGFIEVYKDAFQNILPNEIPLPSFVEEFISRYDKKFDIKDFEFTFDEDTGQGDINR